MNYSVTWADFYLVCFAVGFCFSFFSFLLGSPRGHFDFPHGHAHVGGGDLPAAHGSAGQGSGVGGKGTRVGQGGPITPAKRARSDSPKPRNAAIMASSFTSPRPMPSRLRRSAMNSGIWS